MYSALDSRKVIATVDRLALRIEERFGAAGLASVARELCDTARRMSADARMLTRPNWRLRIATGSILVGGLALFATVIKQIRFQTPETEVVQLVQIIEPAANIAILMAVGIIFVVRMEARWKQKRALQSLHALRSLIHIIDMHQLTKDPSLESTGLKPTKSSPPRRLSRAEIERYLDYCSEMLSLTGKLAAFYAESIQDAAVIDTVNELEGLSTNLSRKIWQKIMILDRRAAAAT